MKLGFCACFLLLCCRQRCTKGWIFVTSRAPSSLYTALTVSSTQLYSTDIHSEEWSIADDWSKLSSENPQNNDGFKSLIVQQYWHPGNDNNDALNTTPEEQWLQNALDTIARDSETNEDDIDTSEGLKTLQEDGLDAHTFLDDMGREVALLVRCNQAPEALLTQQGRFLPPLNDSEKCDLKQLIVSTTTVEDKTTNNGDRTETRVTRFDSTPFLKQAVKKIFDRYAVTRTTEDEDKHRVMPALAVAKWLNFCTSMSIGPHDPRVTSLISKFSNYGTGVLSEENLQTFYMATIVGDHYTSLSTTSTSVTKPKTLSQIQRYRNDHIQAVWRDFQRHGITSPAEQERNELLDKMQKEGKYQDDDFYSNTALEGMMDECEIVDEQVMSWKITDNGQWERHGRSSFERIEMAYDQKTPLYLKDGEYVFIDEESCIGCMQCVNAAPASFSMLEDGRARTFSQRKSPEIATAVASCPVNCMHYVGFERLKELESARDSIDGDGRSDHRHFGKKPQGGWFSRTPLYVSGVDSDANHKSSWYHYLTQKCFRSNECPQKGCFDCPRYSRDPQSNPNLQENMKKSVHVRAKHFMQTGIADTFRKRVEL